jgi:hypothetical protein
LYIAPYFPRLSERRGKLEPAMERENGKEPQATDEYRGVGRRDFLRQWAPPVAAGFSLAASLKRLRSTAIRFSVPSS